ncbi:MAG TPA: hypothetical protein VGD30_05675 [Telluria sp.]
MASKLIFAQIINFATTTTFMEETFSAALQKGTGDRRADAAQGLGRDGGR